MPSSPEQLELVRSKLFEIKEGLGTVLMLAGKYPEAKQRFEDALVLATDNAQRAHIEGRLGEVAFKQGEFSTALEYYERALRLLGQRVPTNWLLRGACFVWELSVQVLHTSFPRWFFARRSLDERRTQLEVPKLLGRLSYAYWFTAGRVQSFWAHLRHLNLAECYPPTPELAQAYSNHGPAMSLLGWYERGLRYSRESYRLRQAQSDVQGQGQSRHFEGVVLYTASRFRECLRVQEEAIALLEKTGDYWEMNMARYQYAGSFYRLGQLAKAEEQARRVYDSGIKLQDMQASGIILDIWAMASGGCIPENTLDEELRRSRIDVQGKAQVLQACGICRLAQRRIAEAAAQLEEAWKGAYRVGVINTYVLTGLVWLATTRRVQALFEHSPTSPPFRELISDAARISRRATRYARRFQNELPHALREQGLAAALRRRSAAARRFFDESLSVAQQQGARYEEALTLLASSHAGQLLGWSDTDQNRLCAEKLLAELDISPASRALAQLITTCKAER